MYRELLSRVLQYYMFTFILKCLCSILSLGLLFNDAFDSQQGKIFPFSTTSRPALGHTQWVSGGCFSGGKEAVA
jgi:hypothetical protein